MNFLNKMSLKHQIWASLIIMLTLTVSIAVMAFSLIGAIDTELSFGQNLQNKIDTSQSIIAVILVITSLVGVAIASLISRQINNILSDVQTSLQSISNGDFTYQLDETRMGEIGKISGLINNLSAQLNSMVVELQGASTELQNASSSLSSVTQETSHNITQQHSETEQVATAVEEMTATAQEIARNAASAAESAKQADEQSRSGALISTEALGGMFQLINDLNKASEVIQSLQAESNNINVCGI